MSETPQRWLDGLIAAEADQQASRVMDDATKEAAWEAIANQVNAGPPRGDGPAIDDAQPQLPPAGGSTLGTKALVAGLALATAATAAWLARPKPARPPAEHAVIAPVASPHEPPSETPSPEQPPPPPPIDHVKEAPKIKPEPAAAPVERTAPKPSKPKAKPKPESPPTLAEEIQLVSDIWDALQSKRHGEAGKLIKRHKKRFAKGQMRQEREAAEVLWLCATGRSERAREARTKFLDRYPESSHRARVEAACD
jgi:hypothetical protein